MFSTERMAYLRILLLKEDALRVAGELARKEIIHPLPEDYGGSYSSDPDLLRRLEDLLKRAETLRFRLGAKPFSLSPEEIPLDLESLLEEVERPVAELEEKVARLDAMRQELLEREEEVLYKVAIYELLEDLNVHPELLRRPRYISVAVGRLPRAQLTRVEAYLGEVPCAWEARPVGRDEAVLVLVGMDAEGISSALSAVRFRPVELEHEGEPQEISEALELERWGIREQLADIEEELQRLGKEWGEKLAFWEEALSANIKLLKEMERFSGTEKAVVLSGFVPLRSCPEVCWDVERLAGEKCYVEYSPVEEVGKENQTPSKFANPRFLKPFERLVATYGLPPYRGIDPTPILAVVFPIMFGAMFGDVGHGAVLALAGALLAFHPRLRGKAGNIGEFLLYMGGASVVFGLLFGSAFGLEFPPLWFRPSEEIMRFMVLCLGFGVGMLSLGVCLNILQSIRRREPLEATFGQWGVFSGIFYWGGLVFLLRYVRGEVPLKWAAFVFGLPLALMLLGSLLWARKEAVEALMGPVEVVMGYLTNTISYVRIAAFGLTHAALMSSVFLIADMLPGETGLSAVVEGNLLVVALEGLVVSIQCMRLTYYEFFSKFFLEEGRSFRPLKLVDNKVR